MSQYDYTFKILMLGDDSAGKTAMTKRYCYNIFNPSERLSIGVDFHVKTIEMNESQVKLQIWDVGGEERFRFLLPTYCLGANAAFLLYDITRPSSLNNISEWARIVRQRGGNIPIMLIGSKINLSKRSRQVPRNYGIQIAEANNLAAFVEICPETGQNVDNAFNVLTALSLERTERNTPVRIQPKLTPIRIKPKFKINEYLELRLENGRTNIYVGGMLFNQCKYLLLKMPSENFKNLEDVNSIDEAAEYLDRSMERVNHYHISPEVEFWGHCSNLQAWYENNYDTRILHRNLAFSLLKALVEAGDKIAKREFKEQVALRLESGYPSVVIFLVNQGYLNYLTDEEVETILKNPNFLKNVPRWFNNKNIPKWLKDKVNAILNDLKCPYCNIKIGKKLIQKILSGESLKCEFCYSNLF
jgi:small GTP-binding protein